MENNSNPAFQGLTMYCIRHRQYLQLCKCHHYVYNLSTNE